MTLKPVPAVCVPPPCVITVKPLALPATTVMAALAPE